VTAEPPPRGRPSDGLLRALAGDAATESLALAAAIPFLFLHATYQPTLSIGVGTTSIDATLADAAIALVVAAAAVRGHREGWMPLRSSRALLGLTAAFVLVGAISLATPSLLGEDYALAVHAISVAKFAWYACLLPATVLLVRGTRDAVPLLRAVVAWSVAATSWGLLQFLGVVSEFEGKRPGQREPSFVGIHDFAALSGAALVVGSLGIALRGGRPVGTRWAYVGVVTGALGVILSGAMTAVLGMWLAVAAVLLRLASRRLVESVDADTGDLSLDEQFRGFARDPWEVQVGDIALHVASHVPLAIRPELAPTGAEHHDAVGGDRSVLRFECRDVFRCGSIVALR